MNVLYVNSLEANNKELARQLASANVLIAEQNKLAKERQEWALHTNEVIRGLNQQLAELKKQNEELIRTKQKTSLTGEGGASDERALEMRSIGPSA